MQWRDVNGSDWCLIDTPETGPYMSLTLGYGLVHEPLTEFGTLQMLAGMLEAELARPVELAPGKVSVPEVSVTVASDTTSIAMRGEAATLSATWQRLADVFAGRQALDAAQSITVNISAAPRDLSSRFGITSLTLATSSMLDVQTSHDPIALLHHLNPAAGHVRVVMCTNTEELMTNTFAPPTNTSTTPSRYRREARNGGMEFPADYALISTVVPRTADGATAVRVLAQQTAQHVGDLTRRDLGVTVSLVGIGPDMLATIMTAEAILGAQQRSQVHALLASRPIPDHRIAAAAQWEADNRLVSTALERRVHGIADAPATEHGTQQALRNARTTLRFFTEPNSSTPQGYGQVQPELASPDGQRFPTRFTRDKLTVGTDVMEYHRGDAAGHPHEYDRVDLRNMALVLEDPRGGLVLIDQEYRIVEILFDSYRKDRRLRELIAQRTEGVPRLTAKNAVLPSSAHQPVDRARSGRWSTVLNVVAVLGVVAVAVILASLLTNRGDADDATENTADEPHAVETTVGQTATMSNWSDVTVHSVQEMTPDAGGQFPADIGHHFLVDIEYCAAQPVRLDPQHFRLLTGEQRQLAHAVDDVDGALEAQELGPDECATGNLGFYTAEQELVEVIVDYRPGNQNTLTWIVDEVE